MPMFPGYRSLSLLLRLLLATFAAGSAAQTGHVDAAAGRAPAVEAFFAPARMQDAELSPSGRWVAALTSLPGRRVGLRITDLVGKEGSQFIEASTSDDLSWFTWVDDDWLVFRVRNPDFRGVGQQGGGLMTVKRDGSRSRMLIARVYEGGERKRYLDADHGFLAKGKPGTTEVIVGQWHLDAADEFSHITPKVLDVATGAVRTLDLTAPRADQWWFDHQGRARVASHTEAGRITLWWSGSDGKWRQIAQGPQYGMPFAPAYVQGDDGLVVFGDGGGTWSLRRFDFAAGRPDAEPMLETPGFSSDLSLYRDRSTGEVLGLGLVTDAYAPVWFSDRMKRLQAQADEKLPGRVNVLHCTECMRNGAVLVYSYTDRDPGTFVLHKPQEGTWQRLGDIRPDIDAQAMRKLEFHRTKARDGRDLPLWVTRPAENAGKPGPQPAVVLVHGGPAARGAHWQWGAERQFLATRGYVVVEPEFRGSLGYGMDHFRAGWKQWGRAMQDDVTDALRFAVAQGWVDKDRVCIMGSSYGGYATLMGLVKDPDQYRCGVAFAAVADPRLLYDFHWSDGSDYSRRYNLPVEVGDRVKDAELLAAGSALDQAGRVKAPLLLAHGTIDRRVPIQHGERMLAALRKQGKTVEWVEYPDEGHGFTHLKNEVDYYTRVESFLARHLK